MGRPPLAAIFIRFVRRESVSRAGSGPPDPCSSTFSILALIPSGPKGAVAGRFSVRLGWNCLAGFGRSLSRIPMASLEGEALVQPDISRFAAFP